jgi:hypothetical protein
MTFTFRHFCVGLAISVIASIAAPITIALAEEREPAVTIPATAAEIWGAIDVHMGTLRGVVKAGKLGEAHEHAFAVRDLVRALPTHSPGLSEAAMATVKSNVKFVDTLATRIDQTGDSGDQAGTEANLAKLEAVLKTLRAQYPTS